MNEDLNKIKDLLLKYVELIKNEYPESKAERVESDLEDGKEIVRFNDKNTLSFLCVNGQLLLPKVAYDLFPILRQNELYGTNKNNRRDVSQYLDTDTTYFDYINHLLVAGLSEYDYFEESLLHETMHLCGSGGGIPLEEGINDLKTRELAQKQGIKIAGYAYSKEVEIAKQLQDILGKDIMDELTFTPSSKRFNYLYEKLGEEKANLYKNVSRKMIEESSNFFKTAYKTDNPFEKAKLYDEIDYSGTYTIIDNYKQTNYEQTL